MYDAHRRSIALSIVVPIFNEEEVLPVLTARLRPVLDGSGEPYEVLAVDDGSTDKPPACWKICAPSGPSCAS
ncbi:glycosyltransferase [Streptomyces sp. NBC_00122]|uniref:glycosyltransferase n=1 Tax=Streptomyces sp. NBC_00122 TaxID=2903623 RepID=UPI0038707055